MASEKWVLVGIEDAQEEKKLKKVIAKSGFRSTIIRSAKDCSSLLKRRIFLCAFLSPNLYKKIVRSCPFQSATYLVMVCAKGQTGRCLAMQADGRIQDWVETPLEETEVLACLFQAMPYVQMANELRAIRATADKIVREDATLLCTGSWAESANRWLDQVKKSDRPLFIVGETGTGKRLLARLLHYSSPRAAAPIVHVNCDQPDTALLEKEIFGEIPPRNRPSPEVPLRSKFSLAANGTVVVEKVDRLSKKIQQRLARAISTGMFSPVGGGDRLKFQARLVFTGLDPQDGKSPVRGLQRDLGKLLKASVLKIPPLRKRNKDIPVIVENTLQKLRRDYAVRPQGVTEKAMAMICDYHWGGNIRELEGVLWGASLLAGTGKISLRCLTPFISNGEKSVMDEHRALEELVEFRLQSLFRRFSPDHLSDVYPMVMENVERPLITLVLRQAGGNQVRAARILGINRNTLRRKLNQYGIR